MINPEMVFAEGADHCGPKKMKNVLRSEITTEFQRLNSGCADYLVLTYGVVLTRMWGESLYFPEDLQNGMSKEACQEVPNVG